MSIGATLVTHNCIDRDYCFEEAIRSVAFCDQISICDGQSTDGTWEAIKALADEMPQIKPFQLPWKPNAHGAWLADLTNAARMHLKTDYHFLIQADEVLHENHIPEVIHVSKDHQQASGWVRRLNFWGDHRHISPPDHWCGVNMIRIAPKHQEVTGDAETIEHRYSSNLQTGITLYHYGSIRRAAGWVKKSREMQQAYWNTEDPIVKRIEECGNMAPLLDPSNPTSRGISALSPYLGSHPTVAHKWLRERGYTP